MLICPDTFLAYGDERHALRDGCDLSRLWRVEVEAPPDLRSFYLLTDLEGRTVAVLDMDTTLRWLVHGTYFIRSVTLHAPQPRAPAREAPELLLRRSA